MIEKYLKQLKSLSDPEAVAGMARFGINPDNTLGVSIPAIRKMAKEIGKNHALAQEFWSSGIHEARILAGMVEDPGEVTAEQMERWAADFDSWDVCDQVCSNLFDKTRFAYEKAHEWSGREEEFVRRAGFVLMAVLSVHDKKAGDEIFLEFLPLIKNGAFFSKDDISSRLSILTCPFHKLIPACPRGPIRPDKPEIAYEI